MKKLYLLIAVFAIANLNAQIINIPDANFKAKLLSATTANEVAFDLNGNPLRIDANGNSEIEIAEALQVKDLYISNASIDVLNGIEFFTNLEKLVCATNGISVLSTAGLVNLKYLDCNVNGMETLDINSSTALEHLNCRNNLLTSLNLEAFANLNYLNCYSNILTSLNVNGLSNLTYLNCESNQLDLLNVTSLVNLKELNCNNNDISILDVAPLVDLQKIDCRGNRISSLDLSGLSDLVRLDCYSNEITALDFSGSVNINYLACSYNRFTTIDVSLLRSLSTFGCSNNDLLVSIFMKNGASESLSIGYNPNLRYICADEAQMSNVEMSIFVFSLNCHVNSYCSFTPSGNSYLIEGAVKFDMDNNGCDMSDLNYANLKLVVTDNTQSATLITDTTGHFGIGLSSGNHTVTPRMENPEYFSISPATATVSFPATTSPFNQNFCVIPNGAHTDLEVTILPIGIARPGFDVTYKIILKNKGNQTQSGSIRFAYDDAILDFVSATQGLLFTDPNLLVFDFDELKPFETHQIVVTFNINSPVEIPAVNDGDILDYTATIITSTDETPEDNIFELHQTVVNSFDPNDKTCLEGATISPEMVGAAVHYMIRFENTGSANAQNIVVKDLIDLTKFDINSLVPIDGSHPFVTKISNGNKVEFIFENIQLPFDDANNDGYVAFKIKTKPTLVVGNTFSNTASIYFDYNFPIVTDPAVTTVTALAKSDFQLEQYVVLHPNPAHDVLNISTKGNIKISSVSIYNTLGQLLLVIPNAVATKSIDVSSLQTGNYFIKIQSDKGASTSPFLKK